MDRPLALHGKPRALQFVVLLVLTVACVGALELVHLPAALMLGALVAAVVLSVYGGHVTVPRVPLLLAQSLVGCLVGRAIGADILATIWRQLPVFLFFVLAVVLFSTVLGGVLAYRKVLPGTTAIWGSSPGGASVMVIMSESFGADIRLVAFMQFLRIAFVAALASVVARVWGPATSAAPVALDWFPTFDALSLAKTLAIAVGGAWLGTAARIPAGALLLPMLLSVVLAGTGQVTITLPPWLMAGCYALVGWSIGLRFTREAVGHAARAFPRIAASTLALVVLCGGLAWLLHRFSGVDPLTAYLATSPGGADSIAIIAAASQVDMPFVMAMQSARFLIVMAVGPLLAKWVSHWVERQRGP